MLRLECLYVDVARGKSIKVKRKPSYNKDIKAWSVLLFVQSQKENTDTYRVSHVVEFRGDRLFLSSSSICAHSRLLHQ